MAIEDSPKVSPPLSPKPFPPFSPKDEKKAQQELARLRKKDKGASKFPKWMGFEGKTLWDCLQLLGVLAIPFVVGIATLLFSIQQANLALDQHNSDQQVAQQQHTSDQQISRDQQRADTLQKYIDNIQDLLLNHNLLGDSPKPKNDVDLITIHEVQALARSRTLTALHELDPDRKGRLVLFLYEAGLIGFTDSKGLHQPIIKLLDADLRGTNLINVNLEGADLSYADLRNANLSHANLFQANLTRTDFAGAIFIGVFNLTQQQIDQVYSCKGAFLPTGITCTSP